MKKYFLTGLATFLPLLLTYLAISFLFNFLTAPFLGLIQYGLNYIKTHPSAQGFSFLVNHDQAVFWIAKIASLLLLLFFTLFIGLIARFFIIKHLFSFADFVLGGIPGIKKIHKALKEAVFHLLHDKKQSFSKVVLVPYPSKESQAIGFITSDERPVIKQGKPLIPVLLPGCPNPMMGFVLLFEDQDVRPSPLTVDEALKIVISCGVIDPSSQKQP